MNKIYIIDIGTNSTRLMLAEFSVSGIKTIYKTLRSVRTGEGVNKNGFLLPSAMERTCSAISEYCAIAKSEYPDAPLFCYATSAVRDSSNAFEFIALVKERCGIDVIILSGEEEASIGFNGAVNGGTGGIIDVGGGSTEVIFGRGGKIEFSDSYQLGCVRSLEKFGSEDKTYRAALADFSSIDKRPAQGLTFYGIGGTATSLAAMDLGLSVYDPEKVHNHELSYSTVCAIYEKLLSLSVEERQKLPGLDERRADIIGFGAAILKAFFESFSLSSIIVSESDGMEAFAAAYF